MLFPARDLAAESLAYRLLRVLLLRLTTTRCRKESASVHRQDDKAIGCVEHRQVLQLFSSSDSAVHQALYGHGEGIYSSGGPRAPLYDKRGCGPISCIAGKISAGFYRDITVTSAEARSRAISEIAAGAKARMNENLTQPAQRHLKSLLGAHFFLKPKV